MTPPPKLLAIDQATVSGWCVGSVGERPCWGSVRFASGLPEGDRSGDINQQFRAWLVQLMTTEQVTHLCYESPYIPIAKTRFRPAGAGEFVPGGGHSAPMNPLVLRRLLWMAGCIEEVACVFGVRCIEARPSEVMKFLGIGGRMRREEKKTATVKMVRSYGFDVADDNCADAVAMFLTLEARLAPELAMRRGFGPLSLASPVLRVPNAKPAPATRHRAGRLY